MTRPIAAIVLSCALLFALSVPRSGFSWPVLVGNILTILVLWRLMGQSRSHGRQLVIVVTLVYAGVSFFNTVVEAALFQVTTVSDSAIMFAGGTLTAIAVAAFMAVIGNRWSPAFGNPATQAILKQGLKWRILLAVLCYCFLYVAAGAAVHPYIREFYADKRLPSLPALFSIQILRGSVYVLLVLPWLMSAAGSRVQLTVSLALVFSVLGGVAPLLLASAFMPPAIRLAHTVEIGVSNFLFGVAVGLLMLAGGQNRLSGESS